MRTLSPARLRVLVLTVACLAGATALPGSASDPMRGIPRRVLWAWERPEQLVSIDSATTAVAVLDRTIAFTERAHRVQYRQHALHVRDDTALIGVVRLEGDAAAIDAGVRAALVHDTVAAAQRSRIRALQIDFDATLSQRDLYRQLLRAIRAELAPQIPLSMTALTSWCADREWLDTLPVVEVVPMAFQMAADRDRVVAQLARGEPFRAHACRRSIGVSLDEAVSVSGYRRIYVFSPRPWNERWIAAAVRQSRGLE
jgi:hypothetical protein